MDERQLNRRDVLRLAASGVLGLSVLPRLSTAMPDGVPGVGAASQPAGGHPPRPARKKALFVYGGWAGHEPEQCRDLFVPWLRQVGFDVVASDTQAPYGDAALMASIDLIVQVWTMGTIAKEPLAGLLAAVRRGVGLAGWHGGLGDAYRQEPEYSYMVGGDWVAHPGNIIEHTVRIVDHDDPITAGLGDFTIRSEQYLMHVNPNNRVLATTAFSGAHDPWIAGSTMPVVWKKVHGAGRVFYTSLGHTRADFDVPEVLAIVQRGMLWASESRYEPTPNLVSPTYPARAAQRAGAHG